MKRTQKTKGLEIVRVDDFKLWRSCEDTILGQVISKLDNLGPDMKKLKENVHAIQVGCQICKGPHLDKKCPSGYYTRTYNQTPSGEKRPNLVKTINKYIEGAAKRQAEQDEWLKTFYQNTEKSRIDHDKIIQKLESQVKTLTAEVEIKVAKLEECKTIFANDGTPFPFEEKCNGGSLCHNEIKCYWESENNGKRIYVEWENLSLDDWLRIRFREVSERARDKILRDHWRIRFGNDYDNSEDFKDLDGCRESKENKILETIINKLHDEWFKGTHEDDDDLEGIIDYLEPTLYDGFIDSDDEEYKERKCRLLGMPYIKPPLILIEKVKVTRYSVGPGEVYTKIKVSETEELSRTRGNIANIRPGIMEEILRNDDEKELYDEM
ncbi:hypothetical protein Tco_1439245 [Tanacetum coccineum]